MAKETKLSQDELEAREAALAAREAELEKEQQEFAAYKQAQARGEKPDPASFGVKNAKERLYDKVPLTVKQLDIIIGVLFAVFILVILMGMDWSALLG